jgi:DNA repair protein RadC
MVRRVTLKEIPGVSDKLLSRLKSNRITSLSRLVQSSYSDLVQIPYIGKARAKHILYSAKKLHAQVQREKREEERLLDVKWLGKKTLEKLKSQGINTLEKLATKDLSHIKELKGMRKDYLEKVQRNAQKRVSRHEKKIDFLHELRSNVRDLTSQKASSLLKKIKTPRELLRTSPYLLRKHGLTQEQIDDIQSYLKTGVPYSENDRYVYYEKKIPVKSYSEIKQKTKVPIKKKKVVKKEGDFIPIINTKLTVYGTGYFTDGGEIRIAKIYDVTYTPDNIEKVKTFLKANFQSEVFKSHANFSDLESWRVSIDGI